MAIRRVEITVDEGLLAEIDRVRGMVPRAAWVKDALRRSLGVVERGDAVLSGPTGRKAQEIAGGALRGPSGPPPRVYPPPTAREIEATRNIAEQTGVPEPVPGCPECAGEMVEADGRWVCGDCGFTR